MTARALSDRAKKQCARLDEDERLGKAVAAYLAEQSTPDGYRKKGAAQFAFEYNVKTRTLLNHAKGGRSMTEFNRTKQILTPAQEEVLVDNILRSAEIGFPMTQSRVAQLANLILEPWGQDPVGVSWVDRFLSRHRARLQTHWSKHLDMQRAKGLNPTAVDDWFNLVEEHIVKPGILEKNIYAMDESGFPLSGSGTERVVGARGTKVQHKQGGGNKENVTALVTICADGSAVRPAIIFKGENFMTKWNDGNVADASIGHSPNGWTDGSIALEWLKNTFDPQTREKAAGQQRALLLDGHSSHYTPEFLRYALENKITILGYPPHCTHALQGLDVVFFALLKANWKSEIGKFEENFRRPVKKDDFARVFGLAYLRSITKDAILSAFSTTGVCPFNRNVIKPVQMKPSETTSTKASFPLQMTSPTRAIMAAFHHHPVSAFDVDPETHSPAHAPLTPSTPRRRPIDASIDPSLFTPSKRIRIMTANLSRTASGSFLVTSARAKFTNKVASPVLEAVPPLPAPDWSLLNTEFEPFTLQEAREMNRKLVESLSAAKTEISVRDSIIEGAQAQLIIQHLHLNNVNRTLHEKANPASADRSKIYPDGKGRLLTSEGFVEEIESAAAKRKAEEERKEEEKRRKEARKKAQQELDDRWKRMKAAHANVVANWKVECEALLRQGTKKKDLPPCPKLAKKPTLPVENADEAAANEGGSVDELGGVVGNDDRE